MKDIKTIVSKNLATLRKQNGLTQAELAEKINYSDKAISRWEKGDTLPDLNVLYEICEFYNITMNDLVSEEEIGTKPVEEITEKDVKAFSTWICASAGVLVWLVATMIYFGFNAINGSMIWITFCWAVPLSTIVVALFGKKIFNWIVKFILYSVTAWTAIACVYLHLIFFSPLVDAYMLWPIFLIGVPIQAMIFFWIKITMHTTKRRKIKKIKEIQEREAFENTQETEAVKGESADD